jgi:hypothetical protein
VPRVLHSVNELVNESKTVSSARQKALGKVPAANVQRWSTVVACIATPGNPLDGLSSAIPI